MRQPAPNRIEKFIETRRSLSRWIVDPRQELFFHSNSDIMEREDRTRFLETFLFFSFLQKCEILLGNLTIFFRCCERKSRFLFFFSFLPPRALQFICVNFFFRKSCINVNSSSNIDEEKSLSERLIWRKKIFAKIL